MRLPDPLRYLAPVVEVLRRAWPANRAVNVVCHGHSVPAGYFATPVVEALDAYPHLLYVALKERFPLAVINVIVTAVGGEHAEAGVARFAEQVLCHRPDVITLDYALNDRSLGLPRARAAWAAMIEAGLAAGSRMILLTPTGDQTLAPGYTGNDRAALPEHADQIRALAATYGVGLADSLAAWQRYAEGADLSDLLSWPNHPNRRGHELVARELLRWFPAHLPPNG